MNFSEGTKTYIYILCPSSTPLAKDKNLWISNYIHYKVWDEITYPFLNFNGATVEV